MHLKIQRRNGREYLSVVQSYRQDGKVKSRTIETIGYADAFADRYDDPIAHFRAYVDELNRDDAERQRPVELAFGAHDEIAAGAPPARLGAAIALGTLDALGVHGFFHARAGHDGFPSQTGRVFEMLAAERMLHATSKRESWTARTSFPRTCDFPFSAVYEALPCIARERRRLDEHELRTWLVMGGVRDTTRVFLVCGSYAFPVDGGAVRASVAVALDQEGMPMGYHDMEGHLGPDAFRQATDELKERLGIGKAIVVAGGLRDVGPTIDELASSGDGFVLYQRDLAKTPELAAWAEEEAGYAEVGEGVHMKWRIAERPLSNGGSLPVKEVVLRGGGYATRMSHAVLVSSELDMSAAAIVQTYRELWRQAEPFQPLEADFSSMPLPIEARDHIRAHFAICYAAFFALRLLRRAMGWKHNAADTADALMRMDGAFLQQNYYLFSYRSDVTDDIERATGVPCARRLRTRADLRSVPGTVATSLRQPITRGESD